MPKRKVPVIGDLASSFKQWSWGHCLLDAGLVFLISFILHWAVTMPWPYLAGLSVSIAMIVTGSIEIVRRRSDIPRERLGATKANIKNVIDTIPAQAEGMQRTLIDLGSPIDHSREKWKSEVAGRLRAIVGPTIVADYEKCLEDEYPNLAARQFLENLADTLTENDLR